MKTKVKALTSFAHGRFHANAGDEIEVTKGESDELVKSGLARTIDETEGAAQSRESNPENADDLNDLLGDGKMDSAPQNKMMPAHDDKLERERAREIAEDDARIMEQSQIQAEEATEQDAEEAKPAAGKAAPKKTAAKKD